MDIQTKAISVCMSAQTPEQRTVAARYLELAKRHLDAWAYAACVFKLERA